MSVIAMQGGMLAGNSGGGGSGLAPDQIGAGTNLTWWYDGENSLHLQGVDSTTTPATTDGDEVRRTDSAASIARVSTPFGDEFNGGATRRRYGVGGYDGIHVTAPPQAATFYTKPTAGSNPSVASTFSQLFAASNAVYIAAVRINNCNAHSSDYTTDDALLYINSGWMGLPIYKSGGNAILRAFNYDGNYDVTSTLDLGTLGSWITVAMKHSGGQQRIRINGGAWISVASGNTGATTDDVQIFGTSQSSANIDIDLAQMAFYKANISDANILEVQRYFGSRPGIGLSF